MENAKLRNPPRRLAGLQTDCGLSTWDFENRRETLQLRAITTATVKPTLASGHRQTGIGAS